MRAFLLLHLLPPIRKPSRSMSLLEKLEPFSDDIRTFQVGSDEQHQLHAWRFRAT